MTEASTDLTVLAVASGKGGVGKTMISVACAYELSLSVPTLLIDLDFFNRGLSGLLRERREVGLVARPRYLDASHAPPVAPWRVVEVAANLFHVAYPDLVPDELLRFEARTAESICAELRDFIVRAAALCAARAVVLDCHGGPDQTSFAATLLARHTLLISEPDRITLHGTLNFLRQLHRGADPSGSDVRLVFNKVIPAFRTRFLHRMYATLLAIFPLELPLTKAFEETPILTSVYPHSLLAKKTRVLLADLLEQAHSELLTEDVRALSRMTRRRYRDSLERGWWILNESVPLGILVIGAILAIFSLVSLDIHSRSVRMHLWRAALIATIERHPELTFAPDSEAAFAIAEPRRLGRFERFPIPEIMDEELFAAADADHLISDPTPSGLREVLADRDRFLADVSGKITARRFPNEWQDALERLRPPAYERLARLLNTRLDELSIVPGVFVVLWISVAVYLNWSMAIDRRFTCAMRSGAPGVGFYELSIGCLLWQLPSYLVALFLILDEPVPLALGVVLAGSMLAVGLHQSWVVYRDLRYNPHWSESLGRIVFIGSLPAAGLANYFLAHRGFE
jgi:MinD-like ATPase involved in chromosome partitioning or flagellar assembly